MYKHLGFDNMQNPDLPPKPIELMGEKTMEIQDCGKWLRCMRFGKMGNGLGEARLSLGISWIKF